MLNPEMTTEEQRRRGAMDNVATVRTEAAVTGSLGRKRDLEEREKIRVSTQLLTSLQAPSTTWLFATASSQLFGPDQSQGKPCHLT